MGFWAASVGACDWPSYNKWMRLKASALLKSSVSNAGFSCLVRVDIKAGMIRACILRAVELQYVPG